MNQRSVQIDSISLQKILGIRYGEAFALTELSPGVNLIHGPNGSGKTTTARVIHELLWPGCNQLERPTVSGRYREGGTTWQVDIEAGHASVTPNDQSEIVPPVGPKEDRHSYMVALHDLIVEDNALFARAVANLTQGGYDLEAAEQALGFTHRPSMPRGLANKLMECQEKVSEARGRQRDIEAETLNLDQLRKEREDAAKAEREIELLKKAEEYQNRKEEARLLNLKLEELPEGVALLRGDERERLDELSERQEKLDGELAAQQQRDELARKRLDELKLPEQNISKEFVAQSRSAQRRLNGVESDIRHKRDKLAESEEVAERARNRLAEHVSEKQLALLGIVEIGEISQFAREADRVRAQQKAFDRQHPWLDREKQGGIGDGEEQADWQGIEAQRECVAFPQAATEVFTSPTIAVAAFIVAASLIFAFLQHWTWALVILLGLALIAWDWRRRLMDLNEQIKDLNQEEIDLHSQRCELNDRLGLKIEIDDEWLPLLIDNIGKWQLCYGEAAGTRKALEKLDNERQEFLKVINSGLQPFGYQPAESSDVAAQIIEDLDDRRRQHREAVKERDSSEKQINDTIAPQLEEVAEKRRSIFGHLRIEESDEAKVDDWLAILPEYRDLNKQLSEAKTIQEFLSEALNQRQDLLILESKEIQQRIEQLKNLADRHVGLIEQITTIETNRNNAKAGFALSDALEARDAAEAALADSRENCGRAVVGALLSRWVRSEAIEKSRPDVFARANDLLVKFTRGSLELELDDHAKPPIFHARRGSAPCCPLDELSIGERVQLLMAVRVAFLEHDETSRLPLLLDEALGTTDDYRAGVIIDTVMDIASRGRQIFYFTAQNDEVGKWIARLNESGLPNKVIDLSEVRGLTSGPPLKIAPPEMLQPPASDGMSHVEYGRVLRVANIDPTSEYLDKLHIWHLIEDDELIHELLSKQINNWGQLQTLLKYGGAGLFNADNGQFERAKIVARVIQTACQAWRIGRGKQVDRGVLVESKAVTVKFIDEVSKLAKDAAGDAQALLEGLENGCVKGFLKKKITDLCDFFHENGYLSNRTPLKPDDIRVRMMAAVADELRDGGIEQPLIERILAQLPP